MSTPDLWLEMAENSMQAAQNIQQQPRSAVSRAYYATFSASHAILLHFHEQPPAQGNWGHMATGSALSAVLGRGGDHGRRTRALLLKDRFAQSYDLRLHADYSPAISPDRSDVNLALSIARQFVATAKELIHGR